MNGMGAPDVFDAGLRETEEPYFTPLPPGPIALKKSIGIVDYPFTIIVK